MSVTRVVIGGKAVGLVDLEETFQVAKDAGLQDSELLKDLILEKVKVRNYLPPHMEKVYREDLHEEFRVFTGELSGRRPTGSVVEVRLYGASCSSCEQLDAMVMQVLSREGLRVDYQHVTDVSEIARAGVITIPALVVAGSVILSGHVLPEKQLQRILLKAIDAASGVREEA